MNSYISVLLRADKGRYAVPHFNYSDIWELEAIWDAAEEERAEVFTASNMRVAESLGVEYLGALGMKKYELSNGHILNHLDHSCSVELCKRAADAGYQSVMIDASACSLEENIRRTKEVVEYAHAKGVLVEAEIGHILGRGVEGTYEAENYLVKVDDAVELAEKTGVDTLAVGIGTAHGFYRDEPKINIQRLIEVNEALDIPLVLHGGTGVPYEIVRECITNGMSKANFGTLLHATYIDKLRKEVPFCDDTNISDLMEPVRDAVKERVKELIHVCNAQNRY